ALSLLLAAERIALLAVALPDAALLLVPVAQLGDVDLRDRDGHDVLALLPDQLSLRDVLAEVLPYATTDDLLEPPVVLVDAEGHAGLLLHVAAGEDARDVAQDVV